jgi:hypothetical protein
VILFPYEKQSGGDVALIPVSRLRRDFPNTWSYLNDHKDCLESRDGGEMAGDHWYAYSRTQALDLMPLPKVFTPDIAPTAGFSYDQRGAVFFTGGVAGGYGILASSPMTPEFLLGVLNSPVSDFFHHRVATRMRGGWFSYESRFIRNLPIPSRIPKQQAVLESVVKSVLSINERLEKSADSTSQSNDVLAGAYLQQWVNALVYELFFPQELHTADLHFFDLIQAEALPQLEGFGESDSLPRLRILFQKTYAPEHKLRQALYRLGSLDLVRTIEGKA